MPDTISVGYSVLTSARTVSVKASKYSRSGASGWDVFPGPKNMWIGSEKRHTIHVNGWPMFIVPLWWSWHGLPLWCCEGTLMLWASRHLPKLSEPDVSKVLVNREEKRTQRNQLNGRQTPAEPSLERETPRPHSNTVSPKTAATLLCLCWYTTHPP